MRILIASNTYWSLLNFRVNLIKALQSDGHEVLALAPKNGESFDEKLPCETLLLKTFSRKGGFGLIRSIRGARKLLKAVKPDLILSYTPIMNVVMGFAVTKQTRLVCTINGLGHLFREEQPRIFRKFFMWLYSIVFKRSSHFIFQNHDDFEELRQGIAGLSKSSLFSKGSGVDLKLFSPNNNSLNKDVIRVGFFGRFVRSKGIDIFLEVVKQLKNEPFSFILGGTIDKGNPDSISNAELDDVINNYDVEYIGFSREMHKVMDKVDVIMFPSRYREGVPRILLEAAAKGKTVLTRNSIGCKDAVDHGISGFFIDTATEAVTKLRLLQNDRNLLATMGLNARKKAENEFDEQIVIDVYRKVVDVS